MCPKFLVILSFIAGTLCIVDGSDGIVRKGPLMEVLAGGTLKKLDEYRATVPAGFPGFQKLAIRKDQERNAWIISGTVISTNSGGLLEGIRIYAGYGDGRFDLVAMSNLKGEVLFSVFPIALTDALKQRASLFGGAPFKVPAHLYIGEPVSTAPSLVGETLREYRLQSTQ